MTLAATLFNFRAMADAEKALLLARFVADQRFATAAYFH